MLKQIQEFLKNRRGACLSDIATHVGADPQAVSGMLEILAAKHRIRKIDNAMPKCGGCTHCVPQSLIVWEWCGDRS